jgi:hypothetical protein
MSTDRKPRSANCTHFKWHVIGTICDEPIDKKYCSLFDFLAEYGGDKTPLNLTRGKLARLRNNWEGQTKTVNNRINTAYNDQVKKCWNAEIREIKEKRATTILYT